MHNLQINKRFFIESRKLISMVQNRFLQKIEDILPANSSLASELSDILEVSQDSAYRRIRGETALTIDEVAKLCRHFKISFDAFNDNEQGIVTFSYQLMDNARESFKKYLGSQLNDLHLIKNSKHHKIIYACEDIPIFYNYQYPSLGAFKMYYWMRSIMDIEVDDAAQFSLSSIGVETRNLGREIYETYIDIPSVEIWTETTFISVVKQIKYYWESGKFQSKDVAMEVIEDLEQQIEDIQKQAELGKKFIDHPDIPGRGSEFELYISDIELGNNTVLVDLGQTKLVYMGHMSFSTISTPNKLYVEATQEWLSSIIKKSTLVSGVSEKVRFQFFKKIKDEVKVLRTLIEED